MILKGDCVEHMNAGLVKSDFVCADPPYGIAYQSAWRTDKRLWKPKIENDEAPFLDWIQPAFNLLPTGGRLICFYRWDVQNDFLEAIESAGFTVKSQIVWDKVIHGMGDLKGEFAPQHELALYATKGRYQFKGKRPKTIYRCQRVDAETQIHPNEKPVHLMRAIIRDLTIEGETVYDPFAGSFATYKAALEERRAAVTSELSDHYIGLQSTIGNSRTQQSLF